MLPRMFLKAALVAALALSTLSSANAAADSVVVFNELHYHPADLVSGTEWIELHSLMGVDVDISDWMIDDGVSFKFPEGTIIPGHGFLLIAADPSHASLVGKNALGPFVGQLANGGERVRLVNNSGRVMDSVTYGDDNDWPVGADGSGATLAKQNESSADARPGNWVASPAIGGSPGAINFPAPGQSPTTTQLIALGSSWKYQDAASAPPSTWNTNAYDDSAWPEGDAALYAGDTADTGAGVGLLGYWPLDETSGTSAPNSVTGAQAAQLFNGASWLNDPQRGQVLAFGGSGDYADAGSIPQPTTSNDFTWSFWAYDQQGASNNVIVGNRYSPSGADFTPREFIKFTTNQFEWHRQGAAGGNIDYAPISGSTWIHHAVVKQGSDLTYYRDGVNSGTSTITGGLNNPQPLYFGGDQANESWAGRLDEPAIWERALPSASIAGLADESFNPETAPTIGGGGGGGNLQTELAGGTNAYYFRKTVAYGGNPSRTSLTLQLLVDDGAIVYLNGVEVHRENMPAGAVSHGTFASSDIGDATLSSGFPIPASALVQGANLLAIEVHQSSAASTDMVFAATLSATELPPDPSDLGTNIVLSEIAGASDPSFQIELTNLGGAAVDLAGYVIESSTGQSYTIAGGTLNPDAFLAISATTLGFNPIDGDRLFVRRPGQTELADARSVTNRLRGRSPDGRWLYPASPTFGTANVYSFNEDIVINEIMYNARPIREDEPPAAVTLVDWGATWRYNESGTDAGDTWELNTHPAGGDWLTGAGPLGFENSAVPIPIVTNISRPVGRAIYFESDFSLTAAQLAEYEVATISHTIDDGAVFYLNGVEISRFKMDPEPTIFSTLANAGGETVLVEGVDIPASLFLVGTNRLSVEVHQQTPGSSDIVFGLKLEAAAASVPFQKSDEQWIELHNRGASPVDLSGWEFSDGIAFGFPLGTTIASDGYLIVARDATALAAELPGATIVGDWSGNLSRGGERLILRDASKNIADEVRFYDDGRWPASADGGGASLELIDPHTDNDVAESWSASDEGARSDWQTYSYRASGANHGNDPTTYNEFIFGMLDNGEFLIDDIRVIEDPDGTARQLIQNGNFSSGTADFWRLIGTHRHAEVIADPESPGNNVLHMATNGSTEHQHNNAGTTLKSGGSFVTINSSLDYEISFRAKWLSGSNQLHTRLYFNRAARTTHLDTPVGGGTPGAPNSRLVANAGPALTDLKHSPPVPAANESCVVTARASDVDGIDSLTLFYSVDGNPSASTAMTDQGGDLWAGTIPGQAAASKVQFYIEAQDVPGSTSLLPQAGADSRAVIPFQDGQADLDYGDCQPNNLRIVMTNDDRDFMHTITNVMSNDRLGCTVIWNESEIYYDCGVRLKGSQRGRPKDVRVGFNLRFPADQLFLGAHETIAIDRSGSGDQFSQKEIMVKHAINHAGGGIPGMEDDLIRVIAPKSQHTSSAMLLKSRYDSEFLDNIYDNGGDGTAWEYELIYYPTSTTGGIEGLKLPNPDSVAGVGVSSLGSDKELYRWHWLIKNNRDADDYAPLIEMLQAYGQGASAGYLADMDRLLDVDQFLRSFAVQVLFGIGDNYSSGSGHNAIFYRRPEDGKFLYFPWDMDFTFNRGATSTLTPNGDLDKLLTSPANRHAYYGHLHDIVESTYNTAYMTYWANHYSCFLPAENLAGFLSYINTRSNYATSQISSVVPPVTFAVTTGNTSTSGSTFTISGDGWVDVREIRVAGSPGSLPITWTDNNSFQVTIPISPGSNTYAIEAYGFDGNLIGTDSVTITGTGSVIPATAGSLVISEIMFNPSAAVGEDADDYEFLELLNVHPTSTLDLTGLAFADGVDFPLPALSLPPGERVIVARNLAAFRARYGAGPLVAGEYMAPDGSNKLSNGGERILLNDALGSPIADLTYSGAAPWPDNADGDGYSLELINPSAPDTDPSQPINWRSSRDINGTPGTESSDLLDDWATANGITDLSSDPDEDGSSHLAEFVFGTDPFSPDAPNIQVSFVSNTLSIQLTVRNGADGVSSIGTQSEDLATWADATYLGRQNNGDGQTSQLNFGTPILPDTLRTFLRLEITELP